MRKDSGDLYYFIGTMNERSHKFNILNELANTGNESTQTDVKGIVNLTVNLYKGLKYEGLFSYASSHSTARDYATDKVLMWQILGDTSMEKEQRMR